jgi:hypothetical protein
MARLAVALLVAAAGCRPSGPLEVSAIQVGRSLNSDNSVGIHTTRFKPDDTIYVAVLTRGAGAATLGARFSYAGRVLSDQSRDVAYRGDAATEFHLDYAGNLPTGGYRIEIRQDGRVIAARDVRVED